MKQLVNTIKLLLFAGVFFLVACENDIEKIKSLTDTNSLPDISGQKVEIIYNDSGRAKMQLSADLIQQFAKAEKPYIEFPKGIHVVFFDDSLQPESDISANYAKYFVDDKLWEAHGNVIATNTRTGERLNTEELFWDENKALIYSNSFSRIENKEGTFYGRDGFESNQQFNHLKLKGSRGSVNINDEENSGKNP
ncbi:MAG: LPS export ABC transporter periplasmic protein LptC [Bacteroidales bacterium]|nr:LPS export ABC transporter periplasmic protein LptC [Bacteroidales bacterium]